MEVTKKEVEDLLDQEITDEEFSKALEYAKRKQEYIYSREHREVVMQPWYLAILTKEYVISLAFSKFTMDLCEMLNNIEKEHLVDDRSTPISNYIVPQQTALNQ